MRPCGGRARGKMAFTNPLHRHPDKEPAQKNRPGPVCSASVASLGGPSYSDHPLPMLPGLKAPPNTVHRPCSQTGWFPLCPWGLSARIWGFGLQQRGAPQDPRARGTVCLRPGAVTSGFQPGSSHLKTCRLPVLRPESGLMAWRGAPQAPGAGTLPASPALGNLGSCLRPQPLLCGRSASGCASSVQGWTRARPFTKTGGDSQGPRTTSHLEALHSVTSAETPFQ